MLDNVEFSLLKSYAYPDIQQILQIIPDLSSLSFYKLFANIL